MERRHFLAALGAVAAIPTTAGAQTSSRLPEVGFLYPGTTAASVPRIAAFLEGLKSKGYVDGRSIVLVALNGESRSDRFEALAREMVGRNVRVLFAVGPRHDPPRLRGHKDHSDRGPWISRPIR